MTLVLEDIDTDFRPSDEDGCEANHRGTQTPCSGKPVALTHYACTPEVKRRICQSGVEYITYWTLVNTIICKHCGHAVGDCWGVVPL